MNSLSPSFLRCSQWTIPSLTHRSFATNKRLLFGPRQLPIPDLADTLDRYLCSVQPLLERAQFEEHEKLVRDFQRSSGPSLHHLLQEEERQDTAAAVWAEQCLARRDPLPVNSSVAVALDPPGGDSDQLTVSARFLNGLARRVRKRRSSPAGTDPEAYDSQLGCGRLPREGRDATVVDPDARHIVVIHRDRFFRLDIIDADQRVVAAPALRQALRDLRKSKPRPTIVGRLTTAERDAWARNRGLLEAASASNTAALSALDTALLVLVLEDAEAKSPLECVDLFFKGVESRWYDKPQLVVTANGLAGLCLDPALGDTPAWLAWAPPA
eukprot:EG_transcript_19958